MDLRNFIEVNMEEGYIGSVLGGAESSMFHPMSVDASALIKKLLDISDADKLQIIYSQLQSGGISETQLNMGFIRKKLSFCTDFSTIINNILTMLGYDFAKHLIALNTLNLRLESLVNEIRNAKSYEQCKCLIHYVYNILSLDIFEITDEFDVTIYETPDISYTKNIPTSKISFLEIVLENIDKLITMKNKALINKDRTNWANMLSDLIRHMKINEYIVDSIDDLCIILGDYDVGYKGSFLRQFNTLYNENYADVPPTILTDEYIENKKPHIEMLLSVDFENYRNYLHGFNKYFRNVYKLCYTNVCEKELQGKEFVKVNITDKFYEKTSHVVLNLFIRIAKNITSAQSIQSYFGKSNRVQFIQIISALIGCQPRTDEFTDSQREAIHYFLLTSRLLNDSYTMLINHMNQS